MNGQYQTSVIAAIVGLVALAVMLILGLGAIGRLDSESTPLILSVVGLTATIITSFLAVVRTDRNVILAKETNGDVRDLKAKVTNIENTAINHAGAPDSHTV